MYPDVGTFVLIRPTQTFYERIKLRDELLDRELFDTLWEVQVLTEQWRHEYNHQRPHSALGYRPPAPEAILTSSAPSAISVS